MHRRLWGKHRPVLLRWTKKYNAKVIAFAGSVAPEAKVCNRAGIDAFFPIVRGVTTLEEAIEKRKCNGKYSRHGRAGISAAVREKNGDLCENTFFHTQERGLI